MTILIKVTKEILERSAMCGFAYESESNTLGYRENCAVALAVREILPSARVSRKWITNDGIIIWLPNLATQFINQFDCPLGEGVKGPAIEVVRTRRQMDPISFEIDVPSGVIDRIGLNEVYKILSESKTLELVQP